MKCIASFIILALTCLASVFARNEVGRLDAGGFIYACYDDNRATLIKAPRQNETYLREYTIPASVNYKGKDYQVTMVWNNAFKGSYFKRITIDPQNKALLLKKNSFTGIIGLYEFNINSKKVEPEIGAFEGLDNSILFQGVGTVDAVDKLAIRYLKKWKLPQYKNYSNISEWDRMTDLYILAKNVQNTFGQESTGRYAERTANALFTCNGNKAGVARVYRALAVTMGFNDVLVGYDNMNYYWIYAKVNVYEGERKWHVLDLSIPVDVTTNMDISFFQDEREFVYATLTKYYKNYYTIDPHTFLICQFMYFYHEEGSVQSVLPFDTWLRRNDSNGKRTL